MYLKALEIHGFKSFPDKTLLSFDRDITAIVGPNGSGKSNISDAIRWVMGEQSTKALRGGKMEDVIFGGTEKRPQLGYAEVSLILENSDRRFDVDSDELMITRRYYRSGDSEYYINKSMVRLKDVNELLMDTGLGREGYSIIGQGRIDEVLSVKSTDRREIFEEAAGISKFRHRKEEAERKLLRTEENLVRINDKINELEYQVEPLREQAEVARRYLNLRDELKVVEVSVWLETLDSLGDSSKQLFGEYEAMRDKLEREHKLLKELYAQTESQSERMRRMDVSSEELRAHIAALEGSAASCESETAVHMANVKNNEENIRRAEEDILREGGRAEGISEQIAERERRIAAIAEEAARLDSEITALLLRSQELSEAHEGIAGKIAALHGRQLDVQKGESELRSELSALAASAQELMDRESGSASELLQLSARLGEAREQSENAEREYKEAEEGRQSLENTVEGYQLRQSSRKKRSDEAVEKNRRLQNELDALKSRIAMLEDMEREYQGYSKAVRTVMQEQSHGTLKNIHGTIASIIRTEDKYTYAIETALGGAMQNIVVGSEADGKAAINMLKRRDGGRATFMPLSMRGSEFRDRDVSREPGYEGLASELLSFDGRYRGVIEYLIGRTVVASDIDAAISISNKYSSRFAIVTLDGQVMNRGGSMTGGSAGRNTGILSRANELTKLREQSGLLEKDLEESSKACAEHARELEKAASQLDIARAELRAFEDKLLTFGAEREQRRLLLSELESRADGLKADAESLGARMEKNRAETGEKRGQIAELENQMSALTAELDAVVLSRSELSGENDELAEKLGALRIERASLDKEREEVLRSSQELEELRRDMSQGRDAGLRVIEEYRGKNLEIHGMIDALREKLDGLNIQVQEKRAGLNNLTDGRLQLEGERTRREKECQEKNTLILDLERETARLEQKKQAAEMEQKQIIDKLWDTYELGPTAAQGIRAELESLQKGTRKVAELKRSIAALGTPNLGAIDEYARVSERYEYLKSQHEDISKAKAELERIIRDITSEMTNIFAESFERIKKSFATTFVELFGGGYGELALEDESDILNCGIEIHVQPPGKAVRSLSLLSGGEKAFVAIALYFAILKVSPTPFCIMDEIEAALDETNVLRFATYLRNLSLGTQFLIITHRRGTMEESDVLYGVTMQEQGVSRILAMDLNEAERRITAS